MKETRKKVERGRLRTLGLKLVCGVALWALMSASAYAQGSITGVTVDPAQAVKGQEVAVQIAATDNTVCADLQIMFGDGASTVLENQSLVPGFQIKHQYTKAGTYTVMVRGINGCSGTATAVVKVKSSTFGANPSVVDKQKSSLDELCQKVDCVGATSKTKPNIDLHICVQPEIKALFLGKIQPGGVIAVKGCGFGSVPGEISLELSQPPFHSPSLEIIEWKDGLIGARIPDHSPLDSGVIDQPARLKVKTKSNKQSNSWEVNFVANKTIIAIPPGVVKSNCSDEAFANNCDYDIATGKHSPKGATYHGLHDNAYDFDDSDEGWDEFTRTLKNGWQFEAMTFDYVALDDEKESYAKYLSGFTYGSSSLKLKIKWRSDDTISYWGYLYIIGPVGVPYK
ncbi:MAG: PKD domain-containing protein [Pyrinomonadaceae bacterium]|nr:PKD domain-containing protein [Pyrinomonadaceae bacterium]